MRELPYIDLWRRELYAGRDGQRPDAVSTWKFDGLLRAANLQHKAEETARMLEETLAYPYAHPDTIRHFLEQYERECDDCHRAFLNGLEQQERDDAAA